MLALGQTPRARRALGSSARSSSTSDDGRRQIAAVRTEMHAGQRDLLEPGRGDALDFAQRRRRSARCAARPRVVGMMQYEHGSRAAGLHAQRERGAAGDARLDRRAAAALAVAEPLGRRQAERRPQQRNQLRLVVVRHDPNDVRQRARLRRAAASHSSR